MILVTGGAGFIGSHLVDAFSAAGEKVRVLDDLSTGMRQNLASSKAGLVELLTGDITDFATCMRVTEGVDAIFHQAAARAVGLSVEDPVTSDRVNTGGTVNLLQAARLNGVRKVILASSSSVYGGVAPLPTRESAPLTPKSPYAVSKAASEAYCKVFGELFGIETVVLRYFNVFGPRQHPDSPYAAAIPLFVKALLRGESPRIHGDGMQCRDFTYVADVVAANIAALDHRCAPGETYNIAGGKRRTVLEVVETLKRLLGSDIEPVFVDPRPGDVRMSEADVSKAAEQLGWRAEIAFEDGLRETVEWLKTQI